MICALVEWVESAWSTPEAVFMLYQTLVWTVGRFTDNAEIQ